MSSWSISQSICLSVSHESVTRLGGLSNRQTRITCVKRRKTTLAFRGGESWGEQGDQAEMPRWEDMGNAMTSMSANQCPLFCEYVTPNQYLATVLGGIHTYLKPRDSSNLIAMTIWHFVGMNEHESMRV